MKWLLVAMVTILAVLSTGCSQEQLSGGEMKKEMASTLDEIDTYEFDMEAESTTELTKYGKKAGLETITTGKGVVDRVSKRMRLEMTTTMGVSGKTSTVGSKAKMYCVNDSIYMKTSIGISELPSTWLRMQLTEERWNSQNQLDEYFELLNKSEVEVLGSETIEGTDCYAIKIIPDNEKLWEMMVNEPAMSKQMQEINRSELKIENTSARYWVAKDTYFPVRTEISMQVKLDPEALNMTSQEDITAEMDLAVKVNYHNYNEPVTISLPQEAKEAVSAPESLKDMGIG